MAKGISIHIGLNSVDSNHYDGWAGELIACEYDAKSMYTLARSKNFSAQFLKTKKATRQNVIKAIREASESLENGDLFLLTYSGHGGQIPDVNGDETDDDLDETWVLFDGQLLDDELFNLWADFQEGVRIIVLSDSCHSGSVTKDIERNDPGTKRIDGINFKFMPREVAVKTYRKNRGFYDKVVGYLPAEQKEIKASVILISGCQDDQLSLDGWDNSLFTAALLNVWDNDNFQGNYKAFHAAIVQSIPSSNNQRPNYLLIGSQSSEFENQQPFNI